jgi:hypothetical protein
MDPGRWVCVCGPDRSQLLPVNLIPPRQAAMHRTNLPSRRVGKSASNCAPSFSALYSGIDLDDEGARSGLWTPKARCEIDSPRLRVAGGLLRRPPIVLDTHPYALIWMHRVTLSYGRLARWQQRAEFVVSRVLQTDSRYVSVAKDRV